MVYVPAGSFWMGSAQDDTDALDDEKPSHEVYLIGRLPKIRLAFVAPCPTHSPEIPRTYPLFSNRDIADLTRAPSCDKL